MAPGGHTCFTLLWSPIYSSISFLPLPTVVTSDCPHLTIALLNLLPYFTYTTPVTFEWLHPSVTSPVMPTLLAPIQESFFQLLAPGYLPERLSRGKSDPGIYSQTSLFSDSIFANFDYVLTFICNPQNKYTWGFPGHSRTCVEQKKIWVAQCAWSPLS